MPTIERTLEWECEYADFDCNDNLICRAPGPCHHMRNCEDGTVTYPKAKVEADYTAAEPGRYSGPPENCYEGFGPEIDINYVWFEGRDILNDLPEEALDEDSLLDEIEQDIADSIAEARWEALQDRYDYY